MIYFIYLNNAVIECYTKNLFDTVCLYMWKLKMEMINDVI